MDKGGDRRRGGSSRFSTPLMRQTCGGNNKSSKKERLGIIGEMDQLSQSVSVNSSSKRVKLPKKFSDNCCAIDYTSVPRKLRTATMKRQHESQKICATTVLPVLPDSIRFELRPKDCKKKHKAIADEYMDSKMFLGGSVTTEDEEEAAEALLALAPTFPNNGNSEAGPSPKSGLFVLGGSLHIEPPNEAGNTNNVSDGNKLQKRCSIHVYICQFIKVLQTTASKESGIDVASNHRACVNIISDTKQRKMTNAYAHRASNEAENTCQSLFQDQQKAFDIVSLAAGDGCGVDCSNVAVRPKTMTEAASTQLQDHARVHPINPQNRLSSFDGHLSVAAAKQVQPHFDIIRSQFLSDQHSWGNRFTSIGCYRNGQNTRYDTMTPLSVSSIEMFDSKRRQGSLLQVLGSKHARNTKQQQQQQQQQCITMSLLASNKGNMQFNDCFLVDGGSALKLTL